jgi:hypothetical protein
MVSALYINDVPVECINQAAMIYHVPATLIISVLKVEGGRNGMAKPNSNGTYDYGPMQINTIWLSKIKPYGYTKETLQFNPCANVYVGTWILSQRIADSPDFWRGVGAYHSYTRSENVPYQRKVWNIYKMLYRYLADPTQSQVAHFNPTAEVPSANRSYYPDRAYNY